MNCYILTMLLLIQPIWLESRTILETLTFGTELAADLPGLGPPVPPDLSSDLCNTSFPETDLISNSMSNLSPDLTALSSLTKTEVSQSLWPLVLSHSHLLHALVETEFWNLDSWNNVIMLLQTVSVVLKIVNLDQLLTFAMPLLLLIYAQFLATVTVLTLPAHLSNKHLSATALVLTTATTALPSDATSSPHADNATTTPNAAGVVTRMLAFTMEHVPRNTPDLAPTVPLHVLPITALATAENASALQDVLEQAVKFC